MEALKWNGKPYPKPTNSATERALAHDMIASVLSDWLKTGSGPRAFLTVIEDEVYRQRHMVKQYVGRYGPNAYQVKR